MITLEIKDERGKIEFDVILQINNWQNTRGRYEVVVWHTSPRKRTKKYNNSIATADEIHQAKINFWKAIEPKKETK